MRRARDSEGSTVGAGGRARTNLVALPGAFFGRRADLATIGRMFAEGARLVTLLGTGGIGKTTVARRYGELHTDEHEGVWFCDLTEARTLGNVCAAMTSALGTEGSQATDERWVEQLGRVIGRRGQVLLIVDNCEQVLEPLATALGRWRELAPAAQWLLTSREALHLSGERPHELSSLELPVTPEDAEASEAVQLFVNRARVARPGYALGPGDAEPVIAIVRALDGVPLAIELAAARMGVLGARNLLQRLEKPFEALAHGPRDAPARHQTLERTLAWSWDMLEPREAAALRQCAVFRGGFTLQAAEAVVEMSDVLDVLQALRDKSLLRTLPRPDGAVRLGFYEAVRAFAAQKLAQSGEQQGAELRHTRFFLVPAEAWAQSRDPGRPQWDLAAEDHENLLAVHDRALGRDALLATIALMPFNSTTKEEVARADRALEAGASFRDERPYCWVLFARAVAARRLGQPEAIDVTRAIALVRGAGDDALEAMMVNMEGAFRLFDRGDVAEVRAFYDRALELCQRHRLTKETPLVLVNRADLEMFLGRIEEARQGFSDALALGRALGGAMGSVIVGLCLINLGEVHLELGRPDEAPAAIEEAAHELARWPRLCSLAHISLARAHHEHGDLARARTAYDEALALAREVGAEAFYEAQLLASLGALLADAEDAEGAKRVFDAAEALVSGRGVVTALPTIELHRGHLDLLRARVGDRERHLGRARDRLAAAAPNLHSEARFARRLLQRALAAAEASTGTLLVSRDGHRYRMPDGRAVDLTRRPLLCRLLLALVEARIASPGRPVGTSRLFASAWGGESALEEAMRNRVRVAITALRDSGLRGVLVHEPDGYLLDASVPAEYEPS